MKINNVLEKIDENQIFVPAFQREYVWKRDDAKQLIDSLIRDYPTGTMLTWETSNPPELKGPHKYTAQQGSVKLLLDGQQRITTLYMLVRGEIPPYYTEEDIVHDIRGLFVNLDTLELLYYMKKRMEGNPLWQNVTEIFRREVRTRHVVRELEDQGRNIDRAMEDRIDDNIRTIESIINRDFPEQIIPAKASIREAIDIFYKVNASGVALTEAELALAQISGYWPEARDAFKSKLSELAKQGFVFKLDFLVYVMLGCMHQSATDMRRLHGAENLEAQYDDTGNKIRDGIKDVWKVLKTDVLDYVVNLLRTKAYVDHSTEINSPYALVPIIVFCYLRHGKIIAEQQLWRMVKWFYYSQVRFRYVSQLPQKLDFDLRIVKEAERPFEQLIGVIAEERRLEILPEEFVGRTVSHPLFGLLRWYIKSKGATCFTTGVGLHQNMGDKYKLENDHIFPSAILKKHGYGKDNRINYSLAQELTNRAILSLVANRKKSDTSALEYLTQIQEKSPSALEKQCIPISQDLWKIENYKEFLEARRKLLADNFNKFLNDLAEEDESHYGAATPQEMISEGESNELEFKASLRWGSTDKSEIKKAQNIIMKTIAGFGNAEGGTLMMGVTDDGESVGLERDYESLGGNKDEFELHLGGLIDATFGKVFRASKINVSFPVVNGLEICQVDIVKADKPLILNAVDKNAVNTEKFYIRSGNSTQELSMSEASEHIRERFADK